MATKAPWRRNSRAMARPMPVRPPVIAATLPARRGVGVIVVGIVQAEGALKGVYVRRGEWTCVQDQKCRWSLFTAAVGDVDEENVII
jgi:hypothetical protein